MAGRRCCAATVRGGTIALGIGAKKGAVLPQSNGPPAPSPVKKSDADPGACTQCLGAGLRFGNERSAPPEPSFGGRFARGREAKAVRPIVHCASHTEIYLDAARRGGHHY